MPRYQSPPSSYLHRPLKIPPPSTGHFTVISFLGSIQAWPPSLSLTNPQVGITNFISCHHRTPTRAPQFRSVFFFKNVVAFLPGLSLQTFLVTHFTHLLSQLRSPLFTSCELPPFLLVVGQILIPPCVPRSRANHQPLFLVSRMNSSISIRMFFVSCPLSAT